MPRPYKAHSVGFNTSTCFHIDPCCIDSNFGYAYDRKNTKNRCKTIKKQGDFTISLLLQTKCYVQQFKVSL